MDTCLSCTSRGRYDIGLCGVQTLFPQNVSPEARIPGTLHKKVEETADVNAQGQAALFRKEDLTIYRMLTKENR